MDLKLIVLAGAKEGTQIPLKKDKFIIGRASECTLRAGSSAISRRHCAIVRKDDAWLVRDLGSRNGTFLNDTAVQEPTALKVGDEIRVGPLHFRVEQSVKSTESSKAEKPPAAAAAPAAPAVEPFETQDINRAKQPPVKNVGDIAARAAHQAGGSMSEEDISKWLLGIDAGSSETMRETQTLSLEETTAINRAISAQETTTNGEVAAEAETEALAPAEKGEAAAEKPGGWSLFKKKGPAAPKKAAPGKLPPRPSELSKDSREAAADILREMTRRR
jgi:pSer/pThr/pTyr-binding forkhead associated (FHA) protein